MANRKNKKKIVIIGATGSVGRSALEVIKLNTELFEVEALVACSNYIDLAYKAREVGAKKVFIKNEDCYQPLKTSLQDTDIEVYSSLTDILSFISKESKSDTIVIASSGAESLFYFYESLKTDKVIAMANKESIVCSADLFKDVMKTSKAKIIPVDSEHSALFQVMQGNRGGIKELILTASGGPFINFSEEDLANVSKKEALNHPTWNMGAKITIDSASFVNKALEVIEAHYLFDIEVDKINVIIHPQSIMHSGISYNDGSFLGHFSYPSMEIPIAYALYYPNRINTNVETLSFVEIQTLKFQDMNLYQRRIIKMAKEAVKKGGNSPCIFNTANEVAVENFLQDKVNFIDIIKILDYALNELSHIKLQNPQEVINEYFMVRAFVEDYIKTL